MLGSLRINGGCLRLYEIYVISLLLCGPIVLMNLKDVF